MIAPQRARAAPSTPPEAPAASLAPSGWAVRSPSPALPWVDHRVYTIRLRKMPDFLAVFGSLALPVLRETLGHPLGFYVSQVGPLNQFVHLWAYASLADYEARGLARDAHPDFPAYLRASEHLIVAQETRLIRQVTA